VSGFRFQGESTDPAAKAGRCRYSCGSFPQRPSDVRVTEALLPPTEVGGCHPKKFLWGLLSGGRVSHLRRSGFPASFPSPYGLG